MNNDMEISFESLKDMTIGEILKLEQEKKQWDY